MFPKVLLTVADQHLSSRFSYETNFYRFKPHFLRWELGLVYLNTRSTGQNYTASLYRQGPRAQTVIWLCTDASDHSVS